MAAARDLQRAPLLTFTAVIVGLMGLALLAGGAWLAAIGGSLYYVMAGAALLGTAWLLWQRRAAALWLYAALLLGTMTWAISEVGLDFWSLAPRGDVLAPLGVWLLLPFITAHLVGDMRSARWGLVAVLA
ncbi:MAG: membrane-bound PQQ-dependent dehydrogenase, glucose/quinate/shikimate family, partial [Bradyrhizobium sp.]|nr:membrane-bound PQQ-dependent dehydrogenase, glucose/quinate/shikimate family [Bradyrhizobium sp.]